MTDREWTWYVLNINPEPWAIGPLSVGKKNGKMFPMVGRNTQLHFYKEAVKEEIRPQVSVDMLIGPVELQFYFWRRRDEYKTPQARSHRKHEADVTNLQKATEDALQGILFKNDKDTNDIHSVMVEQGEDVQSRVIIGIRPGLARPKIPSEVYVLNETYEEESDDNSWFDQ